MSDSNADYGAFVAGFLIGGLVGAATALLMAPQSGEETRAYIRDRSIELRDKAYETADQARARAEEALEDARERADAAIQETRMRAEELTKMARRQAEEEADEVMIDDSSAAAE
jgi:gas vesicle protein